MELLKINADLHTHTDMSHGKDTAETNVRIAIERGLKRIAICDHGPGHITYGIRDLQCYIDTIDALKQEYSDRIEVLCGIEFNLLSLDGDTDMPEKYADKFDIRLLGFHKFTKIRFGSIWHLYVGRMSDPEKNTAAFLKAMDRYPIDILAHPGYAISIDRDALAEKCGKNNILFEINEKHTELEPADIAKAAAKGAHFIISSDAHRAADVGICRFATEKGIAAGVRDRIINLCTDDGHKGEQL